MAQSSTFTVGIVQEAVTNDVDKNVERAVARIREAAEKGAQIVSLQELFNAPYFCKSQKHERFDLAEPIPGPTIEAALAWSQISAGYHRSRASRPGGASIGNSAASRRVDRCLVAYPRCNTRRSVFNENSIHPGDSHSPTTRSQGRQRFRVGRRVRRLGVLICWIVVPGPPHHGPGARPFSIPLRSLASVENAEFSRRRDAWRTAQRAHATQRVTTRSPNRVGTRRGRTMERVLRHSFIADHLVDS